MGMLRMFPVDTLKQHGQLRGSQMNLTLPGYRPDEVAPLKAFYEHTQPVRICPQEFYHIPTTTAEDKKMTTERIIPRARLRNPAARKD